MKLILEMQNNSPKDIVPHPSGVLTGNISRRDVLKGGLASIVAAGIFPRLNLSAKGIILGGDSSDAGKLPPAPFFVPFTTEVPRPGRLAPRTLMPAPGSVDATCGSEAVLHGIAPEFYKTHPTHRRDWDRFRPAHYLLEVQPTVHQFIPGIDTPCIGYNGIVPGPTIRAHCGQPMVVRMANRIDLESSLHLHGSHSPSHSDGHPNFYCLPNECRDYYYPNALPLVPGSTTPDVSEGPSTMWYHDHGNDVTAHNVAHGLAGFCIFTDDLEKGLVNAKVLPAVDDGTAQGRYDIPLVLQDQAINPDGTIYWDPLNHDGRIGNIFCVNGVAQPKLTVERRKYRFRLLNGSLARVVHVRFSHRVPTLQIGNDSWLLPQAVAVTGVRLTPAKRADWIVDFSSFPEGTEIYLENIMEQTDGRGPKGLNVAARIPYMKIVVTGKTPQPDSLAIKAGTPLRPHVPLHPDEVTVVRQFDFERKNGAWVVNGEFWNPARCDADIKSGAVEKWILKNGSGGWWHPIHIHLESHQIQTVNGAPPPTIWAAKSDTTELADNTTVEMLMQFRTFTGPFVFHCHNNNHEDMRMMKQMEVCNYDPVTGMEDPPLLNGQFWAVPPDICGIPQHIIDTEPQLFT